MPSRLAEVKQKKKKTGKSRFKPSVQAKRRETYYKTGKGSVGVLPRRPRVARYIRKIRLEQNARFAEITGTEVSEKKKVLSKGCVEVFVGALDASANQILELAAAFAKQRPRKGGMKLRISDLMYAKETIAKLKRQ